VRIRIFDWEEQTMRPFGFLSYGVLIAGLSLAAASMPLLANPGGGGGGGASFPDIKSNRAKAKKPAVNPDYVAAVAHVDAGRFADAVPLLQKVVAAEPENADAYNYLGFTHRKLGKTTEAYEFYKTALKLNPEHLGAREYLGELYLQLKDLPDAETQLAELKRLCPKGCEQLEDLEKEIAEYKKANP
jgi:tetratricopeptide (TPR) repeat protein